jgi:hypothetical protein
LFPHFAAASALISPAARELMPIMISRKDAVQIELALAVDASAPTSAPIVDIPMSSRYRYSDAPGRAISVYSDRAKEIVALRDYRRRE